jgi:hypothetical protein
VAGTGLSGSVAATNSAAAARTAAAPAAGSRRRVPAAAHGEPRQQAPHLGVASGALHRSGASKERRCSRTPSQVRQRYSSNGTLHATPRGADGCAQRSRSRDRLQPQRASQKDRWRPQHVGWRARTGGWEGRLVHATEDEAFVLLEGSIRAWVGSVRRDLSPGGAAFLPHGVPHAFR